MTPDDSTALGGQPNDDTHHDALPVFSSVSARGAYTVGNLDALIQLMNGEQQDRFRLAIVKQAWDYIKTTLDPRDEEDLQYRLNRLIGFFYRYLVAYDAVEKTDEDEILREMREYATQYSQVDVTAAAFSGIYGSAFGDLPRLALIMAVRYGDVHAADCGDLRTAYCDTVATLIKRWQVVAAWAVLHGGPIPESPSITSDQILARMRDLPAMYQEKNLDALIYLMDQDHLIQFRSAVLGQALHNAEKLLQPLSPDAPQHAMLKTLTGWLPFPDKPEPSEHEQLTVGEIDHSQYPQVSEALHALIEAFQHFSNPALADYHRRAAFGALRARLLARYMTLARSRYVILAALNHPQSDSELALANARLWQIEVAWAILHDDPIPPLEMS
jgi:hypothetical protein